MAMIIIDGQEIEAEAGSMIIQAADKADIYIPRFCYHEKLSIAANCRMCLVEVEKAPKPFSRLCHPNYGWHGDTYGFTTGGGSAARNHGIFVDQSSVGLSDL
ncbi:MAG: hypothetical protein CM1200mP41_24920 [Gammaproteobacteria bacterium]|nr:MAG: hypothetical protein CM1200mP41_24920 [Gammaproteobacteria bacterium]